MEKINDGKGKEIDLKDLLKDLEIQILSFMIRDTRFIEHIKNNKSDSHVLVYFNNQHTKYVAGLILGYYKSHKTILIESEFTTIIDNSINNKEITNGDSFNYQQIYTEAVKYVDLVDDAQFNRIYTEWVNTENKPKLDKIFSELLPLLAEHKTNDFIKQFADRTNYLNKGIDDKELYDDVTDATENRTKANNRLPEISVNVNDLFIKGSIGEAVYNYLIKRDIDKTPAIIATLSAISAKLGNRVYVNNGLGYVVPNLFTMFIGKTGAGKDLILSAIKDIVNGGYHQITDKIDKNRLTKTDVVETNVLLPSKMTQAYLNDALFREKYGLISISEYSKHLNLRSENPDNIEEMLLETYNAHFAWRPTGRISKEILSTVTIKFPAPSLVAGIQPDLYLANADERMTNGLLSRFNHVPLKEKRRSSIADIKKNSIHDEIIKGIFNLTLDKLCTQEIGAYDVIKKTEDYHTKLDITDLAIDIYDKFYTEQSDLFDAMDDDVFASQANKLIGEMPFKMATLFAFANLPLNNTVDIMPSVKKDEMDKAIIVCLYLLETMDWVLGSRKTINPDEEAILMYLKKNINKEFTVFELKRASRKIKKLTDDRIRKILHENERIGSITKTKTGKNIIRYQYNL